MALFDEIIFLEGSGKHAIRFFNQQYDDVMFIEWSPTLGDYTFDHAPPDVLRLGRAWGGEAFNAQALLDRARRALPLRDRHTDGA